MSQMQHHYMPLDGNSAAAHIAYYFSDISCIYPITPSSPMAEQIDQFAAQGRLNYNNMKVNVQELNHEGGAAGAVHGAALQGCLATTFTASQGLLLMIPNLYKIAGEHLPVVFHVAARTIATHALSIHGDHGDIMACRQTGVSILIAPDVQECMDFAIVSHLAAIKSEHPVINCFDGFRTSHTIKKCEIIDYERLKDYVPWAEIEKFKTRAQLPQHPHMVGSCQGPPVFLQAAEADNQHYAAISGHFQDAFKTVEKITGRHYEIFDYYGAEDATDVIVIMGSGCVTVQETIDYLMKQEGRKVGAVFVRLYRPFDIKYFVSKIPATCKRVCVLDRVKEDNFAAGNPLREDVVSALAETDRIANIKVIGGRYGQSSKDFLPCDVVACYDNLASEKPMDHFVCSINDDVTHKSLPRKNQLTLVAPNTKQCLFIGLGSDGTVGANKSAIKIISENTPQYTQGYFDYDSFKAGGLTMSHLRFGPHKIGSEYLIYASDFTSVSQQSYWNKYKTMLVERCNEGSILLLNTTCKNLEELTLHMPKEMRAMIAAKHLHVYLIDASEISLNAGLPGRTNSAMQTAFFMLSGVLPKEEAIQVWKKTIVKTFSKKGQDVVDKNIKQVDLTLEDGAVFEIKYPENWGDAEDGIYVKEFTERLDRAIKGAPEFIKKVMLPTALGQGEALPVSAFTRNGAMMTDTTKYYKRGIAVKVPVWQSETCIQCLQCVNYCPHAVIRPYLATEEEIANSPMKWLDAKNPMVKSHGTYKFCLQPDHLHCTGCGVCANVCPTAAKGTLKMEMLGDVDEQEYNKQAFLDDHVSYKCASWSLDDKVKALGYFKPYFQYNGACAGCGEVAYIANFTRLFGRQMIIANATGCSSIYGFSFPYSPYATDADGCGPAWSNSLFEDNAEFGYGQIAAVDQRRKQVKDICAAVAQDEKCPAELKAAIENWLANAEKVTESVEASKKLQEELAKIDCGCEKIKFLKNPENQNLFIKPVFIVMGGDGACYDIGFGGLDHIMASSLDFTYVILDTEVYSNTGGQKSKATPKSAVAKFAAAGKQENKKDMGKIIMSYPDAYVASINLGSNFMHAIRSMKEAVEHHGPSMLICYCPCMEHGLKDMALTIQAEKLADKTGYWLTYTRPAHGKIQLMTQKPAERVQVFLDMQNRFKQLKASKPEEAKRLSGELQQFLDERYDNYVKMSQE